MNNSKIEWCTKTWNPVTGCRHGCDYCFANDIACRFKGCGYYSDGKIMPAALIPGAFRTDGLFILEDSLYRKTKKGKVVKASFPFGFNPTLHKYRYDEPAAVKKPQNVFVVDMGDLFGKWVPDGWIREVYKACEAAPQHNYLFLTKNPGNYLNFISKPNMWLGTSLTGDMDHARAWDLLGNTGKNENKFLSIEPLTHEMDLNNWELLLEGYRGKITLGNYLDWVIVGAMTGPGSAAHQPRREWIQAIWGQELIQEYPEGLRAIAERKGR